MFNKKNWFVSWPLKSSTKQIHSLENLKSLYNVLFKNQTVTEQNKHLLVETLRSIAEILIWGDQNDSSVFDFFLEKNMLSFFLKIMKQKCGSYVCVQLLQTLNILFENIRDETSLYYLLSNNHVNSIIVHKFDFSDEEVMAYYISFLKTLSFKLNDHTIHFFYNEHTHDFPLYTEAIKFFNHSEKMVRIAVRTLTLNVFKVEEKSMLKFVSDHTAVPYFSNLVWFIGNHILDIDNCLRKPIKDQQMLIKLDDLVAEHLDHLHYLNDILLLRINDLNQILTDHLLNRLLIPLYIYSLVDPDNVDNHNHDDDNNLNNHQQSTSTNSSPFKSEHSLSTATTATASAVANITVFKDRPRISRFVSLFLLSQIFLIISYDSLVQQLIDLIIGGNFSIFDKPQFIAPHETLEESLVNNLFNRSSSSKIVYEDDYEDSNSMKVDDDNLGKDDDKQDNDFSNSQPSNDDDNRQLNSSPIHEQIAQRVHPSPYHHHDTSNEQVKNVLIEEFLKDRPFLESLFNSFDCSNQKDDHLAIFSLSLIYAIIFNAGIKDSQVRMLKNPQSNVQLITDQLVDQLGASKLIDHITQIISLSGNFDSFIRPITLELSALLLMKMCVREGEPSTLSDHHLAIIEQTKENSTSIVRNHFRNENEHLFLDLFEDEYTEFSKFKINVEYLMMDANLLIPPRQLAPLMINNLPFTRRLPFSDIEKARYALRVFFIIRNLSMKIVNEKDDQLPLTNLKNLVSINDNIDLNNCNLVHCYLQIKNQSKEEGYIVILDEQLVFIEPDNQRIGSVSAKYTANLQNVDVYLDKDDSRSLLVTIRPNLSNGSQTTPKFGALDLNNLKLSSSSKHSNTNLKLLFDDYIRCKVTEQHISRGKQNVIQRKLRKIATLIDIELDSNFTTSSSTNQSTFNGLLGTNSSSKRNHQNLRPFKYSNSSSNGLPIPGAAKIAIKHRDNSTTNTNTKRSSISSSSSHRSNRNSRDNSPRPTTEQLKQEEIIMMKDLSPKNQRKRFTTDHFRNSDDN